LKGNAKIIGAGNGNPTGHKPDKYPECEWRRKLFNGECRVIIQSSKQSGLVKLIVSSNDLKTESLNIQLNQSPIHPFVP
jgi:beta-galactosidase